MEHSFANILKNRISGGQPLWPAKMLAKYLRIKAAHALNAPLYIPIFASVSVTQRCNSRCAICRFGGKDFSAPREKELTLQEFKRVVDELDGLGTEVIGVTGGEPLLREDIFELFAYIKGRGLGVHLSTNGTLLDDRRIGLLLDSGVDWVNVSVDGASAEKHDAVRGTVAFEKLRGNLLRFLKLRRARGGSTKLNLVMVINGVNLDEAAGMVAFAKSLGVDGVGFMPFHPLSLDGAAAERLRVTDLPRAEKIMNALIGLKRAAPIMDNTENYLRLFMGSFKGEPSPLHCYALLSSLAVDTYGNVYPCFPRLQMERAFGNLRGGSLREVLASPEAARAAREVRACKECRWNCHTELNLVFNSLVKALLW